MNATALFTGMEHIAVAARDAPFRARARFYRDPEGNLFHILFRRKPL